MLPPTPSTPSRTPLAASRYAILLYVCIASMASMASVGLVSGKEDCCLEHLDLLDETKEETAISLAMMRSVSLDTTVILACLCRVKSVVPVCYICTQGWHRLTSIVELSLIPSAPFLSCYTMFFASLLLVTCVTYDR